MTTKNAEQINEKAGLAGMGNKGWTVVNRCSICLMLVLVFLSTAVGSENVSAGEKAAISQKDFGITPNNSEDQTSRIQEYLNETARRGGGQAYLSAGYYVIRGSLTIPTAVILTGSWSVPHHGILERGTVLRAHGGRGTENGPALLELQQSSGVMGLTIIYPEQKLVDIKPYPWTIHGRGMHNTIENITLVNSYQGICIGPESNELHLIRNVFGCVLHTTDIGRIENVHFNPHYWSRSGHDGIPKGSSAAIYMQEHLEAFTFARTDWEYVTNTFVFGAKIGYRFIAEQKNGGCNGQFHGIGADMCRCCVLVDKAQPWGILISNGEFVSGNLKDGHTKGDRVGIRTSPTFKGTLQLSNCSFWGFFTNMMRLEGQGCTTVCQANFNNHTPGEPVIDIKGGRASVSNCFFNCEGPHIRAGKDVKKVFITNNFADGGVKIVNNAADRLTATDNE